MTHGALAEQRAGVASYAHREVAAFHEQMGMTEEVKAVFDRATFLQ